MTKKQFLKNSAKACRNKYLYYKYKYRIIKDKVYSLKESDSDSETNSESHSDNTVTSYNTLNESNTISENDSESEIASELDVISEENSDNTDETNEPHKNNEEMNTIHSDSDSDSENEKDGKNEDEDGDGNENEDNMKESLENMTKDIEKLGLKLPSFMEILELLSKEEMKEKCEKDPEQAFQELLETYPGKSGNAKNYIDLTKKSSKNDSTIKMMNYDDNLFENYSDIGDNINNNEDESTLHIKTWSTIDNDKARDAIEEFLSTKDITEEEVENPSKIDKLSKTIFPSFITFYNSTYASKHKLPINAIMINMFCEIMQNIFEKNDNKLISETI